MSNGSFKNVTSKFFYENMILDTIDSNKTKKTKPDLNQDELSKFEYVFNTTSGRNSKILRNRKKTCSTN